MKRKSQMIMTLLFIIFAIEIVIIAPRDVNLDEGKARKKKVEVEQNIVGQIVEGVYLIETKKEEKEWELWADKATSFQNKNSWNLEIVRVKFFTEDGIYFEVTGKMGKFDRDSKNMVIEGDVVTQSSNGYTFKTEVVDYDNKKRILQSPTSVKMDGPQDERGHALKLEGNGMVTDLKTSLMKVQEHVKGHRTFEGSKVAKIKSKRAQFSAKKNQAHFLDNVVMDMQSMRLSGSEALFVYEPKKNTVDHMVVKGGVRITDMNKLGTAREARVYFEEDRYELIGSPIVIQDNDELRGEKIIFLEGGKKIKVIRPKVKVDKNRRGPVQREPVQREPVQ